MEISGVVVSGLGEGEEYVRKYLHPLREVLGFSPFPGTLNLRVEKVPKKLFRKSMTVNPPDYGLFSVDVVKATVENMSAAVVRPKATSHGGDMVEILAPVNLRKELGLKDGDLVKVRI